VSKRRGCLATAQGVLGSARTGLMFTRSQEGTQLGWLTQTGQTEQGIQYHVPSCWVLVGELAGGKAVTARECAGHRAVRVALCISLFVLYILFISIVVVTVPFVCCSVKLPLSRPTSVFFSFHSPAHPSGGRAYRATALPFIAGHGQTATQGQLTTNSI